MCLEYIISLTIFYNFESNIQTKSQKGVFGVLICMNFYRVFSFMNFYNFLQFLTSAHAEAAIPTASWDGTSRNPLQRGPHEPNHAWMFVWSTPKIICVWCVICTNFYRVFSFMNFYNFLRFLIQHPN